MNTKRFKTVGKVSSKVLAVILSFAIVLTLLLEPSLDSNAVGWKGNDSGWWYEESDGSYPSESWKQIDGIWYYFDAAGYMVTGWRKISGVYYYFESSGAMAADKWIGDYYVDASGAWTETAGSTGWVMRGGKWYFYNEDGSAATGWKKSGRDWYYLDADGSAHTGWLSDGSDWCVRVDFELNTELEAHVLDITPRSKSDVEWTLTNDVDWKAKSTRAFFSTPATYHLKLRALQLHKYDNYSKWSDKVSIPVLPGLRHLVIYTTGNNGKDAVRLFGGAADCAGRTSPCAGCTSSAGFGIYPECSQCFAHTGRTAMFQNVSFIFIPEEFDRAQNGVRSRLAQSAQSAGLDVVPDRYIRHVCAQVHGSRHGADERGA